MSLYLGYVLERAGAPVPKKIIILQSDKEWANRQIKSEFEALFPAVHVSVTSHVECEQGILLIVPYMDDFFIERPCGMTLYKELSNCSSGWVMLYGLRYRKIDVMPAQTVFQYSASCLRVSRAQRLIKRFHMVRIMHALVRSGVSA